MREGWKDYSLGEVAQIGAGNSAPQKKEYFLNGKVPFVRTSDVGQIRIGSISESRDKLNEKGVQKMRLVPAGTVLVPKSGASTFLNHRVILACDAYVSSHLATVKARSEHALNSFLHYFLMTVRAQDLIQDHKYPSLKLSDLSEIRVAIPPLPEQKCIVAILDEAFAGIATAIANTEKNLVNARELFESHLDSVFSRRDDGWVSKRIRDVFQTATGITPSKSNAEYYGDSIPFVKPPELMDAPLRSARDSLSDKGASVARVLPKRSVLVSCIGNLGKIGINTVPVAFNQQINAILPNEDEALPEFIYYQALSRPFKEQLQALASGTTVPIVNKSKFNDVLFLLPAMREQEAVVQKASELQRQTQELATVIQRKVESLAKLKQSLLQKAFSGELTADRANREVASAKA